MNSKTRKRGFTIVELVIVIAVIGILTAVLIPTFSSLVARAHQAADVSTVKTINTFLASEESLSGKPKNLEAMMDIAEENGYQLDNLRLNERKYSLVWDEVNNRLAILDGNRVIYSEGKLTNISYKLWEFVDVVPALENQSHSLYLNSRYNGGSTVVACVGVNVGNNNGVNVSYQNSGDAKNASITTHGGKLTVLAASDNVYHYGEADEVEIIAVAPTSYHLYATVLGNVELKQGRVVAHDNSSAAAVVITASALNAVSVKIETQANVGAVAATNEDVAQSLTSSESITVPTTVKVESTVVDKEAASVYAGGLGTKESPYLIATASQFYKIGNLSQEMVAGKAYHFKQIADLINVVNPIYYRSGNSLYVGSFNGSYDGNDYKIIAKTYNTPRVVSIFNTVVGSAEFKNINLYSTENLGLTLVMDPWGADSLLFKNIKTYGLDNATLTVNSSNYSPIMSGSVYDQRENPEARQTVTFENCANYLNINSGATCVGAFIGSGIYPKATKAETPVVTFKNLANYGNINGTNYVGVLTGNPSYYRYFDFAQETFSSRLEANVTAEDLEGLIIVDNVKNYGTLNGQDIVNAFCATTKDSFVLNSLYQTTIGGFYIVGNLLKNADILVEIKNGSFNYIAEEIAGVDSYKLVLSVSAINTSEGVMNGRNLIVDLSEVEELTGMNLASVSIRAYDEAKAREILGNNVTFNYNQKVESHDVALVIQGNNLYIVFRDAYLDVDSSVTAGVYGYNDIGAVVGFKKIK